MKLGRTQMFLSAFLMSLAAGLASAGPFVPGSLIMPRNFVETRSSSEAAPAVPAGGPSQAVHSGERDSLWNGILIGAAAGTLYGMVIAPPQFCGHNDPECAAIVKVAVGLPSIAAGAGIGALIDYFTGRQRSQSASASHRLRLMPIAGRGVRGVQGRVRF